MNLTPLKYLLYLENLTCVFRNYLCLRKCTRFFAIAWAICEICQIFFNVRYNITHGHNGQIKAQRIYFFSSTAFSLYVMTASLYYSKRFYKLLSNFDQFYNIFDDVVYNQKMKKTQKFMIWMVVLFCGVKILVFSVYRVKTEELEMELVSNTVSQYSVTVNDFRYIFQYFILDCILLIVSEQLRAITRSIDGELSAIMENQKNVGHVEGLPRVVLNYEKINKWAQAYESINESTHLCNSMFSVQLTIMLLIVTMYYIILLYSIAIITVEGVHTTKSLVMNLFSMTVFLLALLVISRAGQKIQNSSEQLRQRLCELCVHTLGNEEYYKLAKDLLRCVRTRPVRIHVFGTLHVNMSMLPSIVILFTSYTVIALQFNNVL
uniref:Gustatory receptor n=1 Tax=Heliothis virescens TaxID=7102 RepID=A0A2A4K7Z5_HELVI